MTDRQRRSEIVQGSGVEIETCDNGDGRAKRIRHTANGVETTSSVEAKLRI